MTKSSKTDRRSVCSSRAARLLSAASVSLMASLAAPNALAQQADASTGADEEIVVTAQKREERLQDVPISIAVLGGEQLDQQSTGGALEALTSVPSISQATSDAGGMTQVSIRGVAPTVPFGGGSSTVGYYLDSIPFGLVNSAAVPNANAYDMSRMEVLRGPQGTLYGASALNGVVRIITNDADPTQFEVKARAGLSSTDGGESSYRADVALNMPIIEDRLALRVVAGRESLGGWIDQPARGVDDANNSTSDNLRLKLAFLPTDDLRIDLGVWYSREEYDAAPYADDDGNQSTPLAQPGETEFTAYNARVTYDLPFMSISSSTSFLDFNQFAYTDASYLAPIDPALLQLYSDLPAEVFTQELLLSSVGEGPWRWSAGFFYRDAQGERYQTLPAALPGPISWRDTSESTAIFGEVTRVFADGEFELTGGLRYFEDTSETVTLLVPGTFLPPNTASSEFDALTPRLVATWLPSPDFTMYASYSEGFRSGLNQTPLTLLQAPLPPAEADRLHNYEIGARGSLFNGFATYDAAVYYINWQDIQLAGSLTYGDPPVYISATINGESASGFGTDLSLTLHPADGFEVGGAFSYNDLTQDADVFQTGVLVYNKGDRLSFSPEITASVFLNYDFALSSAFDARLNINANYTSEQILNVLPNGAQTSLCDVVGVVPNQIATCFSDEPVFVNASFDISTHSGQTLSLFATNLTNSEDVAAPDYSPTTAFRPRPTTIGLQFEVRY